MVAVLCDFRERLRPRSRSLEKTAIMTTVLIKTLRLNYSHHIKLRSWYQHSKLWLKLSHEVTA